MHQSLWKDGLPSVSELRLNFSVSCSDRWIDRSTDGANERKSGGSVRCAPNSAPGRAERMGGDLPPRGGLFFSPTRQPRSWTCNVYLVRSSYTKENLERRVHKEKYPKGQESCHKERPNHLETRSCDVRKTIPNTKYQIPNTKDNVSRIRKGDERKKYPKDQERCHKKRPSHL